MLARDVCSTLLSFDGADESTPVPWIARSYSSSEDARRFTFDLRRDIVFSDGTALTSADVVFSYRRIINLKAAPAALLAGFSISAPDSYTVVITSVDPDPAIPSITTNPALPIVNSSEGQSHRALDFLSTDSSCTGP